MHKFTAAILAAVCFSISARQAPEKKATEAPEIKVTNQQAPEKKVTEAPKVKHDMTLKVLLDKMEKAEDPKGLAKKWKTVELKMQLSVPMQNVKVKVVSYHKYPLKSKTISMIPGMPKQIEVFDGKNAWKMTEGIGVQTLTGKRLEFAEFVAKKSNPALKLTEVYEKVTLDPYKYKLGEFNCYKLICQPPKSLGLPPSVTLVDDKKFLARQSQEYHLTEMGTVPVVITLDGYKMLADTMQATKVNMNMMGIQMIGTLVSLTPDVKIPDSEFALPKQTPLVHKAVKAVK